MIEQQIKDNYLTKHTIRIDPVQDNNQLRTWMSICHIGIIPSMSEGYCYTAVQMQAMGLSLIASKVGALPEVLYEKNTRFVEYGKIQELTDAIEATLSQIDTPDSITHQVQNKKNTQSYNHEESSSIDYKEYYHLFMDITY